MCRCLENDTLFLEVVNLDLFEGMEFSVEPLSNSFCLLCHWKGKLIFSRREWGQNTHTHSHIRTYTEKGRMRERASSPGYESWFMAILFPFPLPRDGLGMGFWPISGWWGRKKCLLGLSMKIFLTAGVWHRKRKALFSLSPSFLLLILSWEIINLSTWPLSWTNTGIPSFQTSC